MLSLGSHWRFLLWHDTHTHTRTLLSNECFQQNHLAKRILKSHCDKETKRKKVYSFIVTDTYNIHLKTTDKENSNFEDFYVAIDIHKASDDDYMLLLCFRSCMYNVEYCLWKQEKRTKRRRKNEQLAAHSVCWVSCK